MLARKGAMGSKLLDPQNLARASKVHVDSELAMPNKVVRIGRPRFTLLGLMVAVLLCAAVMGFVTEAVRIRRVQASYRHRAFSYAQLEKGERDKASSFLNQALFYKQLYEKGALRLARSKLGTSGRWDPEDDRARVARLMEKSYQGIFVQGKQCLSYAQKARVRAEKFSVLKRTYAKAASCLWLPLQPAPADVRNLDKVSQAGPDKGRLPADDDADEP
jgi:hypothetical protein